MRLRAVVTLATIFLLTSTVPAASALPAVEVNNGMIFGGQSTKATNASVMTQNLSDLPAVVEVYTATWCDNCVDVEHALKEVKENGMLTPYHIHSTLSDPFGDEVLEQRFRDRYVHLTDYSHSPPGAVFNGTMKKAGSVPDSNVHDNQHDNRVEEFTRLAQRDLALGTGTTMFSWTPMTGNSGIIGWSLAIDEAHLENMPFTSVHGSLNRKRITKKVRTGWARTLTSFGTSSAWEIRPRGQHRSPFLRRTTGTTWKSISSTRSCLSRLKSHQNLLRQVMRAKTPLLLRCSPPCS